MGVEENGDIGLNIRCLLSLDISLSSLKNRTPFSGRLLLLEKEKINGRFLASAQPIQNPLY